MGDCTVSEEKIAKEVFNLIIPAVREELVNAKKDYIIDVYKGLMEKYGFDVEHPLESQKDQAHVRRDRLSSEDRVKVIWNTAIRWGIPIALGILAGFFSGKNQ